jgi:uncharacterized protein YwgA
MEESRVSNRKDIMLLLLYSQGESGEFCEPIIGRTRIMKLIYLFGKELYDQLNFKRYIPKEKLASFEPYNYGPFSKDVFDDLSFLEDVGFLDVKGLGDAPLAEIEEYRNYLDGFLFGDELMEGQDSPIIFNEMSFSLTPKGREFTKKLYDNLSPKQQEELRNFKKRYNSVSLTALVNYVYRTYPKDAEKSKRKREFL